MSQTLAKDATAMVPTHLPEDPILPPAGATPTGPAATGIVPAGPGARAAPVPPLRSPYGPVAAGPGATLDTAQAAWCDLLRALADVFAAEGRTGADDLALAYRAAACEPPTLPPARPYRLDHTVLAATEGASHPAARAARAAHPVLQWCATGIIDEIVPTEVSDDFTVVTLVGPRAPVPNDNVIGGLFVQRSNSYYRRHAHSAEETYAMLAGEADWTLDGAPPARRGPGALIHHPPEAVHATRTFARPILAAWRWSGNLDITTYRLLEDTE